MYLSPLAVSAGDDVKDFFVSIDWAPILVAVITAISGYITGHRRGRAQFRSGDFKPKKLYPPEE